MNKTAVGLLGLGLAGIIGLAATANPPAVHPDVEQRILTMRAAKSALEPLQAMMAGRMRFDRDTARGARAALVDATGDIPRHFRPETYDPLSRARAGIWRHPDLFDAHARQAKRAARGIRTGSLNRLRQTLPQMINACLACHNRFRQMR